MDMNEMCDKLWQEIQNERSRVQNLESESLNDTLRNTGKPLNEVSARQVTRKIKELKTTAQKALWFLQSFGLTLDSIKVRDKEGTVTELDYEGNNGSASFDNLPEDEKETVRALLYIMDKFCVSNAAYHEVTQISDDIPRSYLIKQCRSDLNNSFHIRRTPGKNSGVEMSFKQELEAQIRKKLAQGDLGRQQIKLSGDGAKMSRIANFMVISFPMLSDGEKVMSCKGKWCICNGYLNQGKCHPGKMFIMHPFVYMHLTGNHTVEIVSGFEDYDVLKASCKNIFAEINELVDAGEIEVDGHKIPLEFYLSGDYKFLLLVLGMNAACADYACIYCTIHKNERWDTSKTEGYYWSSGKARTLAKNRELSRKSTNNYGCIREPLLHIPIENIRVDELHLLLRVTDRLEKNLINEAIARDEKDNFNKAPSAKQNANLNKLVEAIRSCGDFGNLCNTLSAWEPSQACVDSFFRDATEWIKLYLSLSGKVIGYKKASVTPYFHILLYHLPKFLASNTSFKSFTGQGVEKINDMVRSIYHNKSNRHDPCKEAILALKRIDHLQEFEREPNHYNKRNNNYWTSDIFDQRRKRPRLYNTSTVDDEPTTEDINIKNMSVCEIKSKLKEMNISTRCRREDKLREILRRAIAENVNNDNG
ncbi:hypothetical protein P5673_010845 [Acropora cervicornis]|uniref:SAP domain-containing protein n=1 Tax=Acropora cervicornis TaxID=6130 RepID=A0AAD9QQT5_ACRCE|nr:hypothetical protein P5673_010845 [Acropora cervicornis]